MTQHAGITGVAILTITATALTTAPHTGWAQGDDSASPLAADAPADASTNLQTEPQTKPQTEPQAEPQAKKTPVGAVGAVGDGPGDASYYTDASALTLYGTTAGFLGAFFFLAPPDQPRWFSINEGGAVRVGDTVPDWTLGILAGATAGAIAVMPSEARWYHTKGYLGAFAGTLLVTELAKNAFGRHRPDFQQGDPVTGGEDGRKSFFSGHSSVTWVSTTYMALYLHDHVFPGLRPDPDALPWWEVAGYTGLVALSVLVPYSRVHDKRHNPGDVLTGSVVGTATAVLFYRWQNHRHKRARLLQEGDLANPARPPRAWIIAPMAEPLGMGLALQF